MQEGEIQDEQFEIRHTMAAITWRFLLIGHKMAAITW